MAYKSSRSRLTKKGSRKASRKSKSSGHLRLSKLTRSPIKGKKLRAHFSDGTHTDFGASGYKNYGGVGKERHLDKDRKQRYISRHKKRENWNNPKSAGALSRWILWNKETQSESVKDYKRRFNM